MNRGPFPRQVSRQPLTSADTERLLTGLGAPPEGTVSHHLVAGLLDSAAGPARDHELAGEVAAVAAFVLVSGGRGGRPAGFPGAGRRGPVIAAGIAAAAVVALSGAAAADVLPMPIQELAHTTFGAPAPQHSAPLPKATPASGKPAPGTSPSPGSQPGKTTASEAKTGGKASPKGLARGKGKKKKAVPPGQQKA